MENLNPPVDTCTESNSNSALRLTNLTKHHSIIILEEGSSQGIIVHPGSTAETKEFRDISVDGTRGTVSPQMVPGFKSLNVTKVWEDCIVAFRFHECSDGSVTVTASDFSDHI